MTVWKDPKTGRYRYKFKHKGQQYGKKGIVTRKAAAEQEAAEKKKLKGPETLTVSFHELATQYLDFMQPRIAKNTYRSKKLIFKSFLSFIDPAPSKQPAKDEERERVSTFPADAVTEIQILKFLEKVREGSKSEDGNKRANRYLRELNTLYNWGYKKRLARENPPATAEPYPEDQFIKYVPPVEDIDKVLMAANREEMELVIVLYHTAGRISEILRLIWEDVNFERRWVRLWTRKRRGGKAEEDYLQFTTALETTLKARWKSRDKKSPYVFTNPRTGTKYTRDEKFIRHLMENLCARAGVKPFTFHSIRHHVASILKDSGKATVGQIQKFLRHRRMTTTENYLHDLSPEVREIADILDSKRHPWGTPLGETTVIEGSGGNN
ncbi:MAG: tyrosine-type recombinase/integrase [Syntrophobacteraceae bacterium]|jgi:integrase